MHLACVAILCTKSSAMPFSLPIVRFQYKGRDIVILAIKCVLALLVEVTHSERVCGGSCPECSEEKTSNVARVLAMLQEKVELVSAANQVANPL